MPIFGVCLGYQTIGQVFGAKVVRSPHPMHGKLSTIKHSGTGIFADVANDFEATRYHSLMLEPENWPEDIEITAKSEDGVIMAIAHKQHAIYGVQFHPESIASEHGHQLLKNFVKAKLTKENLGKIANMNDMKNFIATVADGTSLSTEESEIAFNIIMSGDATPSQIGAFLMALRVRGETVDEITGAAKAMRAKALYVEAPENAIDVVGTGGDGSGTYNISTGASIVVAACGVPVAKHGNRALSSKSGAADTLSALGVNNDADFELVKKSIWEAGIGFLMAPRHHSAVRHVAGPRVELATRTVFNLLGPICNPSGVKRQLTGVFAKEWVEPIAQTLGQLGSERAWVMHGSDGTDELTTTGPSYVSELKDGKVTSFEVHPEDAGLPIAKIEDLKGGDSSYNAGAIHVLLDGEPSAYRDVVLFNAAAALLVAEKVDDLTAGVALAAEAIDSGKAKSTLAKLVEITNSGDGGGTA